MLDSYFKFTKHLLLFIVATILLTALPVSAQNLESLGCFTDAGGKLASRYLYQSSSYCYNNCTDYQYIYIQNVNCYCTNTKPTNQGTCSFPCPGFGTDICGGSNAYSYWENLLYIGSGDISSSSSSSKLSTKTSSSQSSTSSTTATTSVSETTSKATTTSTELSHDVTTSSAPPQFETVTNSAKETVFITKSGAASSSATASQSAAPIEDTKSGGISGGAIAGIVVGVFGGIAALVAILIFWRRRNNQSAYTASRSPNHFVDPFGARAEDKMAFGHAPPDAFMAIDQRLNPVMLGERRLSEGSIADERDYSRKILRVANPDD